MSNRRKASEYVVDTCVLRKANATIGNAPKDGRLFKKRLDLLRQANAGIATILISSKLLREYREQVLEPRNDFVRTFLALITDGRGVFNWTKFTGSEREDLARCHFPNEDKHLLQTAKRKSNKSKSTSTSTIVTEEGRLLSVDDCTHRCFKVHIASPDDV